MIGYQIDITFTTDVPNMDCSVIVHAACSNNISLQVKYIYMLQ